jgi:hypothetical protein
VALRWIAVSEGLPTEDVLIYCEGEYHVAALVGASDPDPVFMDAHSADQLPWPSHWMTLPPPPGLSDQWGEQADSCFHWHEIAPAGAVNASPSMD